MIIKQVNMKLIVGLGNPGEKYKKTRHNAGRIVVEKLAEDLDFPKFKLSKNLKAELAKKKDIILVAPTTFMNGSGQAVSAVKKYYKIKITDIWVIYDDIDLPLGKIRIRKSGSAGGHKGVQSIINILGSNNFIRFRMGIFSKEQKMPAEKFVLKRFTKKEEKIIEKAIDETIQAIKMALQKGIDKTMNKFN